MKWVKYRENHAASYGDWEYLLVNKNSKLSDIMEFLKESTNSCSEGFRGYDIVDEGVQVPKEVLQKKLEEIESIIKNSLIRMEFVLDCLLKDSNRKVYIDQFFDNCDAFKDDKLINFQNCDFFKCNFDGVDFSNFIFTGRINNRFDECDFAGALNLDKIDTSNLQFKRCKNLNLK